MLMKGNLDSHKNTSVSVGSQGGVPKGTRLEIVESVMILGLGNCCYLCRWTFLMAFGVSNYVECALIDGATNFVALLLGIFISRLTGVRKKKRSHLDSLSLAHGRKAKGASGTS